jgi:hypothetical protein
MNYKYLILLTLCFGCGRPEVKEVHSLNGGVSVEASCKDNLFDCNMAIFNQCKSDYRILFTEKQDYQSYKMIAACNRKIY